MHSGVIGLSYHRFYKMRPGIIIKQRARLGRVWAAEQLLTFSMFPALIFSGVTVSSVLSRKLIWFLSSNWPVPRMSTKWLIPSILSFFWRENCLFLENVVLTSVEKNPKPAMFHWVFLKRYLLSSFDFISFFSSAFSFSSHFLFFGGRGGGG